MNSSDHESQINMMIANFHTNKLEIQRSCDHDDPLAILLSAWTLLDGVETCRASHQTVFIAASTSQLDQLIAHVRHHGRLVATTPGAQVEALTAAHAALARDVARDPLVGEH
jgi:hypothetical protein